MKTATNVRNFIVFYTYSTNNNTALGVGYTDFETKGGVYLNGTLTIEQIKAKNPHIRELVISNIIELTNSDYQDWIKSTKNQSDQLQ